FRWRFDGGTWRTCGRDVGLADSVEIRKHLCVNLVSLGRVELKKGSHTFELRLLAGPGEALTACFDCFVLTKTLFVPRGRIRPGGKSGVRERGWWALEPEPDAFGEAMLDLRRLNEKEAGASGFVGRKGRAFVLGDGTPVKFWSVNCGPGVIELGRDSLDYLAARLAKVGVNMVRYHGPIFDRAAKDPVKVDTKRLDRLHYFVAALKKQGIYTTLSFYFPLWFDVKPHYGIPGYDGIENKKPFALLYFDPRMQEIYRSWAKGLLKTKNPYTGKPLGKEPAVAIVEIINEDSYFFWTFRPGETIPSVQMAKLEKAFGDWLKKRHGSIDKAVAAWGGAKRKEDNPGKGRMALLPAWNMTEKGHGQGAQKNRMSDQLRFLTQHQRKFYEDIARYFRSKLGCRSLISCSNWHVADARLLDGLERYTYTACDVIDKHGYFGGRHKGDGASYSVRVGHTFQDRAGVLEPQSLPIALNQVDGRPHTISEIGWPNPNRFKAEFPFLCASYGSLQGMDGFYFFAVSGPAWASNVVKFPVDIPTVMGSFPACALMYRRGDVQEAETVVHDALVLEDLYAFKGSAVSAPQSLDELRKSDVPEGGAAKGKGVSSIDPLAFFVGRVLRSFGEDRSKGVIRDIRKNIDRGKKTVTSITDELKWDYGKGLVTVDAPRCQGAAGFLGKAGRIRLGDVVIESDNEFGTILVVSLDGNPLASSKKILIQAATEEKTYGWKTEGDRIADLGGYPMMVREVDASVTIRGGARLKETHTLDAHGYGRETRKTKASGKDVKIGLAKDSMYTVVAAP
ncbi:MAG: hypothetical protein ACYTAF_05290, partial [Planctomycetota bacterium]